MRTPEQRIAFERTLEADRRFQLRDQVALVLFEHHANFLIEFLEFLFFLLDDLVDFVEFFGGLDRGFVDLVDTGNAVGGLGRQQSGRGHAAGRARSVGFER